MRMNMLRKAAHFNGLSGAAGWMKAFWLAFVSVAFAVSMVACGGDNDDKCPADDEEWNEDQNRCLKKATGSGNGDGDPNTPSAETDEFAVTYDKGTGTFTFAGLDLSDIDISIDAGKDFEVTVQDTGEWKQTDDFKYIAKGGKPTGKTTELVVTVEVKEQSGKDVLVISFDEEGGEKLVDALTYVGGVSVAAPAGTIDGDWAPNHGFDSSNAAPTKTSVFDIENAKFTLEWIKSDASDSVVWNGEVLGYFMSLLSDVADPNWANPFEGNDKAGFETAVKEFVVKFKK